MKPLRTLMPVALAVMLGLTGCSTSAVSTHGVDKTTTQSVRHKIGPRGEMLAYPKSDHASLKGDKSRQFLALGKENFAEQNYGLSEKYFRQAVEIRTDNASAWAGLAASYDQLGNFEHADRAYNQLKKLRGNDPKLWNNLGYSQLLRGNYKKARIYFNKAQAADPYLERVQGNIHLLEKTISS